MELNSAYIYFDVHNLFKMIWLCCVLVIVIFVASTRSSYINHINNGESLRYMCYIGCTCNVNYTCDLCQALLLPKIMRMVR